MGNQILQLSDRLYHYLQKMSLRETPVLQHLRFETAKLSAARMQIAPEQGQFMAFLLQIINAKKILEIGTYTGYSSLVMAQALPQSGKLITCDVDPESTAMAQQYWQQGGVAHKIQLRLGPALETLQDLLKDDQGESFDFIFLDADKNNYTNYYELSLQLIRQGGIIAIDNVLWSGAVVDANDQSPQTQAIRELNALLHQDERINLSMIPIGDGLTLATKR